MTLVLLAPLFAVAAVGVAAAALAVQRRGQARLVGRVVQAPVGVSGRPTLLYFTGAACTICHTAQRPVIERLAAQVGGTVDIRELDVADQPDLARRYRVMSLPTTIVLGPEGAVRAVNAGFAGEDALRGQLEAAAAPSAA